MTIYDMNRMRFNYLCYLLMISISVSCTSEFQDTLVKVTADGEISKQEFYQLQQQATQDDKYAKFRSHPELYQYIKRYLRVNKIDAKLYNPIEKKIASFNLNIFFENSYSMDGYINEADLKSSVYNMLVNAKQLTKVLRLNFINSSIIPLPSTDLKAYSTGLTQTTFQKLGGARGFSDIADVVKKVLTKTNSQNASILISDFVFSPPKKDNALSYLAIQQVAIKEAFRDQPNLKNLAVAVFQMKASFHGRYYDHNSKTIYLNGINRPYYIWLIGTKEQVRLAIASQLINDTDPHTVNKAVFTSNSEPLTIRFKVVNKGKIGDYKFKKGNELSDAESLNGEFGFGLAVDFHNSLQGLQYFSNSKIYKLSDEDYTLNVRSLTGKETSSAGLSGYTHLLTFKTKKLKSMELGIDVLNQLPSWIVDSSSDDDRFIKTNVDEQRKTFGLEHLINGVSEGFSASGPSTITVLKIKIER